MRFINGGCKAPGTRVDATCSCPQHEATPPRSPELSFPCTPENNGRIKAWLLDRYASSTFKTCPHRALPCMEWPPVEIHIDPAATPKILPYSCIGSSEYLMIFSVSSRRHLRSPSTIPIVHSVLKTKNGGYQTRF